MSTSSIARRARAAPWLAAGLALLGLAASAASLADALAPVPTFCADGGCATVRASDWARPLGVPLPALGVGFFVLALGALAAGPRATGVRRALAITGGGVALGLVAIQGLVLGAWCRSCLVVDGAALGYALAAVTARRWPRLGVRPMAAIGALAIAAIAIPLRMPAPATGLPATIATTAAGLPPEVARAQVAGTVTVVDYVDFECPFCRALHARLVEAIARVGTPVRVVRKMVPLRMHRGALAAAIAWCCAEAQGQGDAMAEALIEAPVADLTPAGCERLAATLGLDLERYRADAASAAILARIDADLTAARAAGIRSLPTIYIGDQAIVGAGATVDELVAALRRAAEA